MILTVLFVVFLVLWLASIFPGVNDRFGAAGGFLPWICVALVGFAVFGGHL